MTEILSQMSNPSFRWKPFCRQSSLPCLNVLSLVRSYGDALSDHSFQLQYIDINLRWWLLPAFVSMIRNSSCIPLVISYGVRWSSSSYVEAITSISVWSRFVDLRLMASASGPVVLVFSRSRAQNLQNLSTYAAGSYTHKSTHPCSEPTREDGRLRTFRVLPR